jgi:SAM-dependent methyltransferase
MVRNFYGVLRILDQVAANVVLVKSEAARPPAEDPRFEKLMNGTIDHGLQFLSPARRDQPTTYYGPNSGIGITLKAAGAATPLGVGVIGLGAGTLAAYGKPGDRYKFYEINPLVVQIANQDFSFLRDSKAKIDIVLGDARLALEQEPPQGFGVLVVDAFSGDSIPVHLLTREAFELYFRHLRPDGVLAVHISNQYLNLAPVVAGAATGLRKEAVMVKNEPDGARGISRATWVLVGNPQSFLAKAEIENAGMLLADTSPQIQWTDDYSSLLKVLK